MEYYSAMKRNEVLIYIATIWVNLENFMLNLGQKPHAESHILHDSIPTECAEQANL